MQFVITAYDGEGIWSHHTDQPDYIIAATADGRLFLR